jgi:hypothetical protein
MASSERQLLLVDIDRSGCFIINKKALEQIKALGKETVAILSVCGPYRTGKSYLLNRFAHS